LWLSCFDRPLKILLVYLQPKDLPEVLEPLNDIFCDKLFLRYFRYPRVYKVANDFIKLHSEYSHIFWLQNDIVLNPINFESCIQKSIHYNFSILGLSMNVDLDEFRNKLAYTVNPFDTKTYDNFKWAKKGEHEGIIKVFHNGGPFLIKRDLYLKFPVIGEDVTGFNADIVLGKQLWDDSINYYLDSEANLKHLRFTGKMQVNLKRPHTEFTRV